MSSSLDPWSNPRALGGYGSTLEGSSNHPSILEGLLRWFPPLHSWCCSGRVAEGYGKGASRAGTEERRKRKERGEGGALRGAKGEAQGSIPQVTRKWELTPNILGS